jgi:subtilisin family serine protease
VPVTTSAAAPAATSYQPWHGTSFAAPHVTGAIALMLEAAPGLTRAQVTDCLIQNIRTDPDTAAGPASGWGAGKLDIHAALSCAAQITP